ncbi:hypothetical protein D3C85_1683240 [compost metagenome]
MDDLMRELAESGLLEPDASIVIEHDGAHQYPEAIQAFHQLKHAQYGDTAVTIYEYVPAADLVASLEEL